MKRLSRLAAAVAMTGLLTTGAITASTAAASASTAFGSCSAQGDYAICDASGTATRPVTITVSVTSSPDQSVFVSLGRPRAPRAPGRGAHQGSFTAQTPVSRAISHPYYQPDSCIVSADAQLQAGRQQHPCLAVLLADRCAASSHEIKGYAGKCADDNGNSSAPRTKVQIWNCVNDASQQWSFSNGELKHGSMCMNDKGTGGSGSPVILWSCNGAANETWTHNASGEYVLKANGLCLDDPAYSTRNGTQLDVYRCNGGSNQRWSLP